MPCVIAYELASSPDSRVSEPMSDSEPTSEPVVTAKVSVGSDSPYVFDLFAAVMVIGRAVMVRFAGTKVML